MYEAWHRYQSTDYAEEYDRKRFSGWVGRTIHSIDMRALDIATAGYAKGSLILDVPCGTGRLTTHLAQRGFRMVGADVSREMIEVARRKDYAGNLEDLVVTPAERLPFPDKYFDHVTCGRFLAHLPPPDRVMVLREMARVSRGNIIAGYHIRNRFADVSRYLRTRGRIKDFNLSRVPLPLALQEIAAAGLKLARTVKLIPFIHDYRYFILERRA